MPDITLSPGTAWIAVRSIVKRSGRCQNVNCSNSGPGVEIETVARLREEPNTYLSLGHTFLCFNCVNP